MRSRGAAGVVLAAAAFGVASFFPVLGPIAGTIAPQFYVNSLSDARNSASGGAYVLVDAASARLYMLENGRVEDSMRVIVGKPETPTPALKSVINYETLNPYWHVTGDLAKTLIAPRVLSEERLSHRSRLRDRLLPGVRMRRSFPLPASTGRRSLPERPKSMFAKGPGPPIRLANSSSTCPTATASISTIRPRKSCSRRRSATSATVVSASKMRRGSRAGCSAEDRPRRRCRSRMCFCLEAGADPDQLPRSEEPDAARVAPIA